MIYDVYTDGSFNGQNASWAFIVVENNKQIFSNKGVLYGEINSMYQIGGEIKAAEEAVKWAKSNNCIINIHHDYTGVKFWATGEWKTRKTHTKEYADFMRENSKYINKFVKVMSHGTDAWNNKVDQLAATPE